VDCSAAATAKVYNAKLVTTDRSLVEAAKSEKIPTEAYEPWMLKLSFPFISPASSSL